MNKRGPRRLAVAVICALVPLALVAAGSEANRTAYHHASVVLQRFVEQDTERRERQTLLNAWLDSEHAGDFQDALTILAALHEPGVLDLWQTALTNSVASLREAAWQEYRGVRLGLTRNEMVPQVARIAARSDVLLRLAASAGLDVTIWSSSGDDVVAAAPPYLIERLRGAGVEVTVLYDSIAQWQLARADRDQLAEAIAPEYQAAGAQSQVRIAVLDLSMKTRAATGFSDWFGDGENVVMRSDSFLAYLDVFSSDGSPASIAEHVREQYTQRGYRVAGFYTASEFADAAARFFPGRSFDAGAREGRLPRGVAQPALAEGRFHNYDETAAEFNALANSHPEIAQVVKLGESYEGRSIFALKISKDAAFDDSSKPDVLFTGCHHAREWISVEPPVFFANKLLEQYAANDSIKYLVDHVQIWIVPVLNPDGLTYSQGSPNDQMDSARLWRKNRRPISISADCGSSSVGVDLNRNYGYRWRLPDDAACLQTDDVGGSDDPRNETYRGPKAETEPEVKAIKSLVDDPSRHFRAQIDYHNYSQLILYPWGYQAEPAPDGGTFNMLATRISDETLSVDSKTYVPEQAINLYVTTGSSIDYAYGVNRVPAPFVVEMRPLCCGFSVPESEIPRINEETWAGASALLRWSAGPPILESVKAYQQGSDGTFSKLVYAARWSASDAQAGTRQMALEARFPAIEPGRLQLRLQFSKPLPSDVPPAATLGRGSRLDELRIASAGVGEGFQKTNYANDTWIGEATIVQDANQTSPWRLSVAARDSAGFSLDAAPATIAMYGVGTGGWLNYEGSDGAGSTGGADVVHVMAATLRADSLTVVVGAPLPGERLAGAERVTAEWTLPKNSGFSVARYDVLLSGDGGFSFTPVVEGISSALDRVALTLPAVATTGARLRVLAHQAGVGNTIFGDSPGNFTIGKNVGGQVEFNFVSSERIDQNWSDGAGLSGPLRFAINFTITNRGGATLANTFVRVAEINGSSVLLSRDARSDSRLGARQSLDGGGDYVISPGETVQVRSVVGLTDKKKLKVSVELWGVPSGGTAFGSSPASIWRGKPKSK